MLLAPVDVAARGSQIGQVYVTQQVFESTPFATGVTPFGQTGAKVGQTTGLFGSHLGFSGTHLPAQVWPRQFPFASHAQDGSDAGQAHVASGGTLVPAGSVVVGVPPVLQPQPEQLTSHAWPVGQSASARQPL